MFYWIYPRDGKQQSWDPKPKVNYCVHCILKFIISFSCDKIFTKTLISQIETWNWNCCSYNKHQKILDKHAVPVEAWSSLHPLEVDFVRNLRWKLFLFTTYSTWLGTMLICFSISFHCHFQFRTNPTYICKKNPSKLYKASNTDQNMIHLYICFYYHPFLKFECHWTQNANLKKAIWMIIAIHYYYLRLMSGGFCNQHPLSIYISRLSFTHINAINLWSMKTLPQGGDGAKVKLETHYRVFSNINIQTAPDNSGALRDQQTIIYTE